MRLAAFDGFAQPHADGGEQAGEPSQYPGVELGIRGHVGVVTRCDGLFSIPDVEAHSSHRVQEATYSVRFDARDLWNDRQSGVTVNVDLWDSYLEPA